MYINFKDDFKEVEKDIIKNKLSKSELSDTETLFLGEINFIALKEDNKITIIRAPKELKEKKGVINYKVILSNEDKDAEYLSLKNKLISLLGNDNFNKIKDKWNEYSDVINNSYIIEIESSTKLFNFLNKNFKTELK